ncbi:hypothetical protein CFC21_108247 [Triticum aestivum]|uniref:Uncharacterized protein n=2 Tax=Triticum aestivum TaxID=4565 RepID=A0A9R1MHU1_WHEAT|nr:uncharacterized protein LOC123049569 [Triticum aestivum]KAF7107647.1 hypothetical protein CFC21_108247 [Triticum aestivum]
MDMDIMPASQGSRMKQSKNPRRRFLFLFKQKVGSLVHGEDKVIGPKKMFRLCILDEFGMRTMAKPMVILKSTSLRREIKLRTEKRKIVWAYRVYQVRTWEAFKRNVETIGRLTRTLNNAIRTYGSRRLQAGLFYLAINWNPRFTYTVRSHIYGDNEFLRDLWRKKRLERKMRQTKMELCNTSAST